MCLRPLVSPKVVPIDELPSKSRADILELYFRNYGEEGREEFKVNISKQAHHTGTLAVHEWARTQRQEMEGLFYERQR